MRWAGDVLAHRVSCHHAFHSGDQRREPQRRWAARPWRAAHRHL